MLGRLGSIPIAPSIVLNWISERSIPGDLLLLGSRDPLSRVIQNLTHSAFSHAGIINRSNSVTEAYDFHLTPSGNDEGVYRTPMHKLVERYPYLSAMALYRPVTGDLEKLEYLCAQIVEHSPTYPTGRSLLFATARIAEAITRQRPNLDWAVQRHVAWIGDGPQRMQCAELVTRIYTSGGNGIEFAQPLLARHIDVAEQPGDYETDDLVFPIDYRRSRAVSRPWTFPDTREIKKAWSGHRRPRRFKQHHSGYAFRPDIADFIVPGDLVATDAFQLVESAVIDRRGRIVEAQVSK